VRRHGIAWHEREHGQLFCDDSAQDIIDMLRAECDDGQVSWAMPCKLEGIERGDGDAARFVLATSHGQFSCQSLVVATGGLAIPKIGASPLGYKIAEQFGLAVVAPSRRWCRSPCRPRSWRSTRSSPGWPSTRWPNAAPGTSARTCCSPTAGCRGR
jgi:predicted flavoprotein YhiN